MLLLLRYHALWELHFGDKLHKFLTAKEWAREEGLSVLEAEHHLDTKLFLDEYPRWDVGGLHCLLILQRMFVHAANEGQKEAEGFICQGYWCTLPSPNPEADVSTIQIVGYWTCQKEIWDLYHEVYLLRRLPGLPPCGPSWVEGAILDILSSIRNQLQRWKGTTMLEESQRGATVTTPWPRHQMRSTSQSWGRDYQHDGTLQEAREAHRQAFEAAGMLELNIDILIQEVDGIQCWWPHSHSCSCSHCWGRSLDRCERSLSRHRWERHVTFLDPEKRMPSAEGPYWESQGHSTRAQLERGDVGSQPT